MLPGMELMSCPNLAVPRDVMHHVVRVESSYNPYAIGVVGGRLVRQPRTLAEAVSTARMLEQRGYNFSLGLAQVNRYNLSKYGLNSYEHAFQPCANLVAGSQILRECYGRSGGDWGKSFSCYYSGDFRTGFRHGYVQKVYASMRRGGAVGHSGVAVEPIAIVDRASRRAAAVPAWGSTLAQRRAHSPPAVQGTPVIATDTSLASTPAVPAAKRPVLVAASATPTPTQMPQAARSDQGDGAFVF